MASHCLQDLFTNLSSFLQLKPPRLCGGFCTEFHNLPSPPPNPTTLHISANLCSFFTQRTKAGQLEIHGLAEWICWCLCVNISAMDVLIQYPSTVLQRGVSSKIDQDGLLWSLPFLALHCTVCTSCTMRFVQWPYQMQMTRQVWRRQRPAAGCCHCCTQFHCCTAHVVDSRSVQGRSCILPRLATWPRTCLGSKSSTFLLPSFWTRPLCLSVVLGTSDYDLVAQKIAGS